MLSDFHEKTLIFIKRSPSIATYNVEIMLKRAFGLDRDHDRILFVFDLLRAIAIDVIPEGLFI